MRIKLKEPISPRYIYINPETNLVHLMVSVVGGQEISTDNTCQAKAALREFFDDGALRELKAYKQALEFDIALLSAIDAPERSAKEERLVQIKNYIEAVFAMSYNYSAGITTLLTRPSNLYSIQLRPRKQDNLSSVVNPVFTIKRTIDSAGNALSLLYNSIHSTFPTTEVATTDPRTQFTAAVSRILPSSASFADVQRVLSEQSLHLLGVAIDFTRRTDGTPATKEIIDELMYLEEDATRDDYIEALLNACALDVWETLPTPPFYSISATTSEQKRTERLSILTQFFLATLNVYCKAKEISSQNFGIILDESQSLSDELVNTISTALKHGEDVEKAICNFCNANAHSFDLSRAINTNDLAVIRPKFERIYRTVTATAENQHMDDFMIMDTEATGETAKFVSHQGAICVNFAELIASDAQFGNPEYFTSILADFAVHPAEIPHQNECVMNEIDASPSSLARLNDEQFERLSEATKDACKAHPDFQHIKLLHDVARGRQAEAKVLLTTTAANTQTLLREPGTFTDYSGRTFNCTAYEYAYWAKDTHMCRMLEQHMNEETKADMLVRIDDIEAAGLPYQQNGAEHRGAHFDLSSLKTALQTFIDGYKAWEDENNWEAQQSAWVLVGKAQLDVPAHIAQEYCRLDRSFFPTPQFNEAELPRTLTVYNAFLDMDDVDDGGPWFLINDSEPIIGVIVSLMRGSQAGCSLAAREELQGAQIDLAAIARLDEVRTAELTVAREYLTPSTASYGMSR